MLLLALPVCGYAARDKKGISKNQLVSIIDEYRNESGFEVIRAGTIATSLLKGIVNLSLQGEDDEEARSFAKTIRNIRRFFIIDYEECGDKVVDDINQKLRKALGSSELLMEVKSEDDTMMMYGVMTKDDKSVKDFILYSPESCTLICLFGTISADAIMDIAADME